MGSERDWPDREAIELFVTGIRGDSDATRDASIVRLIAGAFDHADDRRGGEAAARALGLIRLCRAVSAVLHPSTCSTCGCQAIAWHWIDRLLTTTEPHQALKEWTQSFLEALERHHPEPLAERAARLLRARPELPWTPVRLAAECSVTRAELRRSVVTRFGMTPIAYLHLARAHRAVVTSAAAGKVEAMAADVGYRSKKDLYAALDRWTGRTPSELRRLDPEARDALACRLRATMEGGVSRLADQSGERRRRLARTSRTASVPATSAAPPTSATPA